MDPVRYQPVIANLRPAFADHPLDVTQQTAQPLDAQVLRLDDQQRPVHGRDGPLLEGPESRRQVYKDDLIPLIFQPLAEIRESIRFAGGLRLRVLPEIPQGKGRHQEQPIRQSDQHPVELYPLEEHVGQLSTGCLAVKHPGAQVALGIAVDQDYPVGLRELVSYVAGYRGLSHTTFSVDAANYHYAPPRSPMLQQSANLSSGGIKTALRIAVVRRLRGR
ncbi:hypothetical protein ES705_33149 [subsurface metagenome]